jgi:hypothetical protein
MNERMLGHYVVVVCIIAVMIILRLFLMPQPHLGPGIGPFSVRPAGQRPVAHTLGPLPTLM